MFFSIESILTNRKKLVTVLHILSSAEIAGGERYIYDLINHSNRIIRHLIILPYHGPFEKILMESGYNYSVVNLEHQFSLSALLKIVKFIHSYNIDIIHNHGYRANFYGRIAGLITRKRNVSTVHVSLFDYIDTPPLVRKIYMFVERLLSVATHKFICISNSMRDDIIKLGINPSKINLVHNGVDLGRFYPRAVNEKLKKSIRVNGKGPVIGTVGRMVTEKGHAYLIEALKYLKQDFQDLRCLFIGEGPLLEQLKKSAFALGVDDMCTFAGVRTDVERIYPVLDIFVLPSLREPFGLVLLEAMASEIPSIATACGGPLELIESDINGVLVPPKDSKMLAAAIQNLLSDRNKADTIAKKGRKTVEKYFDVKNFAKKMDDIYLSMAPSL